MNYYNGVIFTFGEMVDLNVDVLWQNFLEKIKNELSNLAYETWFSDTKLYKLDDLDINIYEMDNEIIKIEINNDDYAFKIMYE